MLMKLHLIDQQRLSKQITITKIKFKNNYLKKKILLS